MNTSPLPFGASPQRRMTPTRPPAPTKVQGVVMVSDGHIVIKFSASHAPYISAVKQIKGWKWVPDKMWWQVHLGHVRQVRDMARHYGWTMSAQFAGLPDVGVDQVPILVSAEGDQLIADGPYRPEVWDVFGAADCRYQERTGRWFIPAEQALDVILDLQALGVVKFVGDPSALTRQIEQAQHLLRLSRQLEPSPGFVLTDRVRQPPGGFHGFQFAGIEYLTIARQSFAWATMGAGKSAVAAAAMEQLEAFPLLIVPPAGIKSNWAAELKRWIPHRTFTICEGNRASPLTRYRDSGYAIPEVIICNYDVLGSLSNPKSWVSELVRLQVAGVVWDEGHRLIGRRTIRTIAANAIAASMADDAPRFLLTGTPVRNKKTDIHPQLEAINRGGEFGTKKQLMNDERLSRRLRTVCAWRPDPKEVLIKIGALAPDGSMEPIQQIVVVEGDPTIMAEYRHAEENLIEYLRQKAIAKAIEMGVDPHEAAVAAELKASKAEQLMAVNVLSAIASRAKQAAAIEWMQDFMATGEKLLAFAINRDMMDAISLGTIPQINGDVHHKARNALVDRFQDKEGDLQALVLQLAAAGEGLTLTEAWHCMFAQVDWVPGAHEQAASRAAWRMNDPHPVVETYLVCRDTIDEVRVEVVAAKRVIAKSVIDGDKVMAESTFGDVMDRLIKRALE